MKVRDVMTARVLKAIPESTLEEIAMMMKVEDTGAIPVVEEDELIGIVTDRDIVMRCIAEGGDPTQMTAEDIVSEELEVIDPEANVDEAIALMSQKRIRRLPVVDYGELVGMLSIGDIAVKHGNPRESGRALQNVSQGVKSSSVAWSQPLRQANVDARSAMPVRESSGVSARNLRQESTRQRVVSIRRSADEDSRAQGRQSKEKAS